MKKKIKENKKGIILFFLSISCGLLALMILFDIQLYQSIAFMGSFEKIISIFFPFGLFPTIILMFYSIYFGISYKALVMEEEAEDDLGQDQAGWRKGIGNGEQKERKAAAGADKKLGIRGVSKSA